MLLLEFNLSCLSVVTIPRPPRLPTRAASSLVRARGSAGTVLLPQRLSLHSTGSLEKKENDEIDIKICYKTKNFERSIMDSWNVLLKYILAQDHSPFIQVPSVY